MHEEHGLSIVRACKAVRLSRAAFYRQRIDWSQRDADLIEALNSVVAKYPRWGFWKCHDRLRLDGHLWNHKHVHRVYRSLRLNLPRRTRRRLPTRPVQPLAAQPIPNEVWSLDFMSDALYQGRRFRTLNVIDDGVREGLAIEVDTNLPAARVVRVLERLVTLRGAPKALRSDNGPEFLAEVYTDWCQANGIELRYIQPGKPDQNAYVERFNRSYRQEVLDAYLFASLDEVRRISEQWLTVYNEQRPHEALGSLPPAVFRAKMIETRNSNYELST